MVEDVAVPHVSGPDRRIEPILVQSRRGAHSIQWRIANPYGGDFTGVRLDCVFPARLVYCRGRRFTLQVCSRSQRRGSRMTFISFKGKLPAE